MSRENKLVCYTDGSSQPNPGFAGYGVYGYVIKPNKTPKNVNYPVKTNYKYTSEGILHNDEIKSFPQVRDEKIEALSVVEYIGSINDENATNNQGEILGLKTALMFADQLDDIGEVLVISDSKYALEGYTRGIDSWVKNNWMTKAGTEVKNRELWEQLVDIKRSLKEKKIKVTTKWVKGHEDTEGNIVADTYALIGTNYSRNQIQTGDIFNDCCLYKVTPMSEFKKELIDRHFVLEYKSALFHTNDIKEDVLMLVSTFNPFKENDMGKRDLYATYTIAAGGIPTGYDKLKRRFSNIPRRFHMNSIINLDTLKKDKLLTRIINLIGFDPIYVKYFDGISNKFMAFNRDGVIVEEIDSSYTHLLETYKTFETLTYGLTHFQKNKEDGLLIDLTPLFVDVDKRKLVLNFKDRVFDITDKLANSKFEPTSKFFITIGLDTPSYSVFKSIGEKIKGVYVYPDDNNNRNLLTLTFIVVYEEDGIERYLATTNLLNKYLVKTK